MRNPGGSIHRPASGLPPDLEQPASMPPRASAHIHWMLCTEMVCLADFIIGHLADCGPPCPSQDSRRESSAVSLSKFEKSLTTFV
jgi:hypothetical protein